MRGADWVKDRLPSRVKDGFRHHRLVWTCAALALVLVAGGIFYLSTEPWLKTVDATKTTTVGLPGGGDLIIPPGAMTAGAKVSATTRSDQPDGTHDGIRLLGRAVQLVSDPPDAIHGVLTLELPVPADGVPEGIDPNIWFGVSTYDPATKSWQPQSAKYDASRHMVVALIGHFSWWNPFSWNFDSAFSKVVQGFGELVGKRAGSPTCHGPQPGWVNGLAGLSDQDNIAVRACAQSDGDALDVELVNNRPYGQVVRYGSAVTRASHDVPSDPAGFVLSALVDATMNDHELYLPPLTHASISISRLASKSTAIYYIGPSVLTIGVDLVQDLMGPLDVLGKIAGKIGKVPGLFKSCTVPDGDQRLADQQASKLWQHALAVFKCVWDGLTREASSLDLGKAQLDRVAAEGELLARATPVLNGIKLAGDYLWQIGDLVGDWFAHKATARGNGFEVRAKDAGAGASSPPSPSPSASPPSGPSWWECFVLPWKLPRCLFG
jgi:hypothetical protein